MSEYLKDLERWKPGEPRPPINLGAFDNPLLWNMLDPYGADRPHQNRPSSVSRTYLENQVVPLIYRDHCAHRFIPWMKCIRNMRAMVAVSPNCHEFESAWQECRQYERYRSQLLKEKFMDLTKDYTHEEKHFFPDQQYISIPWTFHSWFWAFAASARMAGFDDADPKNPVMGREPNRAMMRVEFNPNNFEKRWLTSVHGMKLFDPDFIKEELGEYPLPDNKKPQPGLYKNVPY
jgi:hypothetical protein